MALDKIWIIWGTVGEYSDRSEWPLCAYTTEEAAQDACDELGSLSRDACMRLEQSDWDYEKEDAIYAEMRAIDPQWNTYSNEPPLYTICKLDVKK